MLTHLQALRILGLKPGATKQEIKEAFRREAKKWHPDVSINKERGEEQFKILSVAYHEALRVTQDDQTIVHRRHGNVIYRILNPSFAAGDGYQVIRIPHELLHEGCTVYCMIEQNEYVVHVPPETKSGTMIQFTVSQRNDYGTISPMLLHLRVIGMNVA